MADGTDVAYSFPMLNSKKIVGYLGDLNIRVSEQVSESCMVHCCLRYTVVPYIAYKSTIQLGHMILLYTAK